MHSRRFGATSSTFREPRLEAKAVFCHLQRSYPERFKKTCQVRKITAVLVFLLAVFLFYRKRTKKLMRRIRLETVLQSDHNAQMSIILQNEPEIRGFDVSGLCVPANEVDGDFYEYLWLNSGKNHFGITVGDVPVKAMKAAMTSVMSNGIIFFKASRTDSIIDIMSQLNTTLYAKTDKKMFTALLLATFNIQTRLMT